MVALSLLALVIGRRLTASVAYSSVGESVATSTALGVSAIAYGVLLLGLPGWIRPWVLAVAAALCVAASWRTVRTWLHALRPPRTWTRNRSFASNRLALAVLGLLVLVPLVCLALYPSTQWDAISFHLPTAKHFLESHRVGAAPYVRYPVFPAVGELLYAVVLAWGSDLAPQLFGVVCLLLVVLFLASLARRFGLGRVGTWASAILVSHPLVIWVATTAYIDMLVTLLVTAAVYALLVWRDTGDRKWLLLAGVFSGAAIGTKYSAILAVGCMGLLLLFDSLRTRKAYPVVLFGLVVLGGALPWFIRSFVYTGNPVWPFLSPVFGYGFWNVADYQAQMADLLSSHIQLRSLWSFLRLPWDLVFRRVLFYIEAPLSLALLLVPLGLLLLKRRRLWAVLALSLGFTILWFLTAQLPRYLLPILPLVSFATAYGLDWAVSRIAPRVVFLKSSVVTVAVACMLVAPGYYYSLHRVSQLGPIPTTQDQRDAFLARNLPTYPAYQYLNSTKGASYVLYALYDENMNYFADGTFMGDHFGVARYGDVLSSGVDGATLYTRLRSLGADHLLVNLDRLPPQVPLPQDEWFAQHFTVLFASAHACLYKLSEGPVSRVESPELLSNPGFEQVLGSSPIGWTAAGNPTLGDLGPRTGVHAAQGSGATNAFFQMLPGQEGNLYILWESVRSGGEGQEVRLQANWFDQQGRFLSFDIRVIEPGRNWDEYEMWVSAPDGAAHVCVYASPHEKSLVEFDDMSFRQVTYAD